MPNYQNNMCSRTAGPPSTRQGISARNAGIYNSRNTAMRQSGSWQNTSPSCRRNSEDCTRSDDFLKGTTIAMAYVPWQQWQNVYEICRGFERGTIFEDLDKPFTGKGGRR